jgi:hypothetical protein
MSTPTTRRHPRSLAEAFPRDHAYPIEHYPEPLTRRVVRVAVCIGCAAFIGWLAAQGV